MIIKLASRYGKARHDAEKTVKIQELKSKYMQRNEKNNLHIDSKKNAKSKSITSSGMKNQNQNENENENENENIFGVNSPSTTSEESPDFKRSMEFSFELDKNSSLDEREDFLGQNNNQDKISFLASLLEQLVEEDVGKEQKDETELIASSYPPSKKTKTSHDDDTSDGIKSLVAAASEKQKLKSKSSKNYYLSNIESYKSLKLSSLDQNSKLRLMEVLFELMAKYG